MVDVHISLAKLAMFQHVLDFDQAYITSTDRWAHLYIYLTVIARYGSKILFFPGKAVYLAVG